MTNCSNNFPNSEVLFREISDDILNIVLLAVGCGLAVLTIVVYIEIVIYMKRAGYNKYRPHYQQRCILVGLYPAICVMSLISLIVPTSTTLVDLLLSCYVSLCIFTFVQMTVDYFGGESEMVQTLSEDIVQLNTPPCCCCCCCILQPITLTKKSLTILKFLSMQVAIVRPTVLFIAGVLWTDGNYEPKLEVDSGYPYIAVISGISTVLSMYGMIVTYRASRNHLRENCYIIKFGILQLAVVLVNLQNIIFSILAQSGIPKCNGSRGPRVRASAINHAILVVEAFLMCLLARYAYRREEPHLGTLANMEINVISPQTQEQDSIRQDKTGYGAYANNAITPDEV